MDKTGPTVNVTVLGILSDIKAVNIDGFETSIHLTKERSIAYAAFHPARIQAVGHLVLLQNRFGMVIGGTHPKLTEQSRKII